MDISTFNTIGSDYLREYADRISMDDRQDDSFQTILDSLMNAVNETNDLQNAAESAEIQFALGESTNTHDLLIAEGKALVALQYTAAVRDKIIDAYNQIMQMQV